MAIDRVNTSPSPGDASIDRHGSEPEASDVLWSFVARVDPLDPVALYHRGEELQRNRVFYASPQPQLTMVGLGEAARISVHGEGRFSAAHRAWHQMTEAAIIRGDRPVDVPTGPVFLGGFSFFPGDKNRDEETDSIWAGFGDALLVLPQLLWTFTPHGAWLTLNAKIPVDESEHSVRSELEHMVRDVTDPLTNGSISAKYRRPAPADPRVIASDFSPRQAAAWKDLVRSARGRIADGHFDKVVLADKLVVTGEKPFSAARTLQSLRTTYPQCFEFAFSLGGRTFAGATPERLAALRGTRVDVTCLAGSAPRAEKDVDDEQLGRALLADPKNLFEHNLVIDMVRDALQNYCTAITIPQQPSLLKLNNVQHLFTPAVARLDEDHEDMSIIELIATLHPTPAVGGYTKQPSLTWLRQNEGFDRGWYAAPVGWIGPDGSGEFAVAIRSALLKEREAVLFAGCGIVGDSDEDEEYKEMQIKLGAMLKVLGHSLS